MLLYDFYQVYGNDTDNVSMGVIDIIFGLKKGFFYRNT